MTWLQQRYDALLEEACAELRAGRAPWWGEVATQGPPLLARSGAVLRGLPAVIAWHVGAQWPEKPLAWSLLSTEKPKEQAALQEVPVAVFALPANGGERLYAAIPSRRPQPMADPPPPLDPDQRTLASLMTRLDRVLEDLGDAAPSLTADRCAIASLTQAFLCGLGEAAQTEPTTLPEAWNPARLARVAAWARLVADHLILEVAGARRWQLRPPDRWMRTPSSLPAWKEQALEAIRHSAWLQSGLPAEVREVVLPGARHTLPEQPLRRDLFCTQGLRRAPALGGLARQLPKRLALLPEQVIPGTLETARWHPHAALGLALAQRLGVEPLPSDPGLAWRRVGRQLCTRLQTGKPPPWGIGPLPVAPNHTGALGLWADLWLHHHRRAWLHHAPRLRVGDLLHEKKWDRSEVNALLEELHLPVLGKGGENARLDQLPLSRIAMLRRTARLQVFDENSACRAIAAELGCEPNWLSIQAAAQAAPWQRHKRAKASGGIRWLDVPDPPLKAAQAIVGQLLLTRFPKVGTVTAFHHGASPALHARLHQGAVVAVQADLANFFGSIRPRHLEPWFGLKGDGAGILFPDWSEAGRRALLDLCFRHRENTPPYLPQGAPSSPVAANLAGLWLDGHVLQGAVQAFTQTGFVYSRYADDLVLSTQRGDPSGQFGPQALALLASAASAQGWRLQPSKSRTWTNTDPEPLHICGLRVPRTPWAPLTLDRRTWRRARAALHRLRHRQDFGEAANQSPNAAHGLLAYAYSATGDLRWLAYTSRRLTHFARALAGPLFSESLLCGWSDDPQLHRARDRRRVDLPLGTR